VSTPGQPSFRLQVREEAGVQVLSLGGRLDREGLELLVGEVRRLLGERRPKALRLELAGLEYLDSAGALALTLVEQEAAKAGVDCRLEGLDPKAAALKALIDPAALTRPPLIPAERRRPFLDQVGEAALAFWGRSAKQEGRLRLAALSTRCLASLMTAAKREILPDNLLREDKTVLNSWPRPN